MGFIVLGFPNEEYDLEIGQIVSALKNKKLDYVQIEKVIFVVFEKMFDKNTVEESREKLRIIAKDLFELQK